MKELIFYALGAVTLASAFLVVLLRRPLHNVLFMILTMIGLAGLFVSLHAEFIAMVQLIVYAGAVMVLFLFVIMLLNLDQLHTQEGPRGLRWWAGALIAVSVAGLIVLGFKYLAPRPIPPMERIAGINNTALLGRELFTTYLLPFEVASILLLAAIIGAVILIRKQS
ncbi:MAG: NADH-quinone oxidoreductase subunit J [Deltaproteobacteria bacterium]